MTQIKGYVQYFEQKVPITWERETKKYVYKVKRIRMQNDELLVDSRLFDDKVHKDEILLESSLFIDKTT